MNTTKNESVLFRLLWSFYGVMVLTSASPVVVIAWLLIMFLPKLEQRWKVAHFAITYFARFVGIELIADRLENDLGVPVMYVVNHGSFVDAIVLVACFKNRVCFVAASEFFKKPFLGPLLRRLDMEQVHRDDTAKAASDTRRLTRRLSEGESLVLFPEGSLSPTKGLRAFYIGAFYIAAKAGSPVIPIGICGADVVLRPTTKLPRRGLVAVRRGEPVLPTGTHRRELESLMKLTRASVALLSGERDLLLDQ